MRIYKKDYKDAGSCNFCHRGEIEEKTIVRPYRVVWVVQSLGNGISVRFCNDCLNKVKKETKK